MVQHDTSASALVAEALAMRLLSASILDAPDIGTHAIEFALHNWAVFPLNGKTPAIRGGHGVLDATTDLATVIARWADRYAGCNIGVRVPEPMMVVDIDPRHGGLDSWAALTGEHGEIPHCLMTLSGRMDGGRHLFMRRPPGKLSTAKLGPGIDLKTSTGYVVVPPSIHPDTGKRYIRVDGPVISPPRWLVDLLVMKPPAPPANRRSTPRSSGRSLSSARSVAGEFNAATSWSDVLMPHGWACRSGNPDANGAVWLHPSHTSNCSATVHDDDRLYIYSTSTTFEVTEAGNPRGYSKFDAYALLNHGGDMKAAARQRISKGETL